MDDKLSLPIWQHFHNLTIPFLRTPMDEGAFLDRHGVRKLWMVPLPRDPLSNRDIRVMSVLLDKLDGCPKAWVVGSALNTQDI